MFRVTRIFTLCIGSLVAWGTSDYAAGQTVSSEGGELQEVIVTAQKRVESSQNVPVGLTALTGARLVQMGADDLEDFAPAIPGLNFSSLGPGGRVRLSVRGVNPNTGPPTVGFYIDDTPIPTNVGFVGLINIDPKLPDVDRIEVLKGPQGTLYGADSMGGTVKVITHAPDSEAFSGQATAGVSQTSHGGTNDLLEGVLNAPLVENELAIRLTGYSRSNSGFIGRIYQDQSAEFIPNQSMGVAQGTADERVVGGRGVLAYRPVEALRLSLSVYGEKTDSNGYPAIDGGARNPAHELTFQQPLNVPEPFHSSFELYSLKAEWDVAKNVNVTSVSSEFNRRFDLVEDGTEQLGEFVYIPLDGPILPAPIEELTFVRAFTQEIRAATIEPVAGWRLLFGGFFQRVIGDRGSNWVVPGSNAAYAPLGQPVPQDLWYSAHNYTVAKEKAVFTQISFDITPTFTITGGTRWSELDGTEHGVYNGIFAGGPTTDMSAYSARKLNSMGAFAWHINPNTMVYGRAAQGLRPGEGQTLLPPTCRADLAADGFDPNHPPTQTKPDSVWNYELGEKSDLLEHRLRANLTAFWIEWKDIQQSLLLLDCGFNLFVNAGSARSRGAELELTFLPSEHWELTANGSYTDATLQDTLANIGVTAGDRVQEVPRIQVDASVTYKFRVSDRFSSYLRLEDQYVGDSWVSFSETDPLMHRPGYSLVGLRLGAVDERQQWQYMLFADNLFDERADLGHPDSLSFNIVSRPRIVVNRPRTIGLRITHNF